MSRHDDFDPDQPHPGSGLLFLGNPSRHAEEAEMAAREALRYRCCNCGEDAPYGFGRHLSCGSRDCQTKARRRHSAELKRERSV